MILQFKYYKKKQNFPIGLISTFNRFGVYSVPPIPVAPSVIRQLAPPIKQTISKDIVINNPAWLQWFQAMFDYYQGTQKWIDPGNPLFGKIEPPHVQGLIAYADNINWKPGASAGYYRWSGSSWVFVG